LTVFLSGPWTHEKAQEWVFDNLSMLGRGRKYEVPFSSFSPSSGTVNASWLGNTVRFAFGGTLGLTKDVSDETQQVVFTILNRVFKHHFDEQGMYHLAIESQAHTRDSEEWLISSQCGNDEVGKIIQEAVTILKNVDKNLTEQNIDRVKQGFLRRDQAAQGFNGSHPAWRLDRIAYPYHARGDAKRYDRYAQRMEAISLDNAHRLLGDLRNSRIAAGYITGKMADFPQGSDIRTQLGSKAVSPQGTLAPTPKV